jgi:hypothetical protein
MFGFGAKVGAGVLDMADIERAAELDRQERRRKNEAESTPLAKEIARMMRDAPEAWTATDGVTMVNGCGLKVTTFTPDTPYFGLRMVVEKGFFRTELSSADINVISFAQQDWFGWRNKVHADEILAELKGSK